MDTVLFLGFASAYALLLIWGLTLVIRRKRLIVSDLAFLVLAALVFDNAVLGLGSFIGEGDFLELINGARYWLHAFVTPLLVLVAWNFLTRAGVRWAKRIWAVVAVFVLTISLIVYEVIAGAASAQLVADREYGILSYSNENAPGGPPLMVLFVAAALLVAGIYVWKRQRWVWLLIVTIVMVLGSAIPFEIPSSAATNAFELILLIGVIATIGFQDRRPIEHRSFNPQD